MIIIITDDYDLSMIVIHFQCDPSYKLWHYTLHSHQYCTSSSIIIC